MYLHHLACALRLTSHSGHECGRPAQCRLPAGYPTALYEMIQKIPTSETCDLCLERSFKLMRDLGWVLGRILTGYDRIRKVAGYNFGRTNVSPTHISTGSDSELP